MPSTRTFVFPSGSLSDWTMLEIVPTWKISLGFGLSMVASCWVERKIRLSPRRAASSACTEDSRPITKGTIMKGKITTSRIGTIGSFVCSYFSFVLIVVSFVSPCLLWLCVYHHKDPKAQRLSSFFKWQLDFLLFDH